MQLFSKEDSAGWMLGDEPSSIKFTLKLGGFSSAVEMNMLDCARGFSPYRSASAPQPCPNSAQDTCIKHYHTALTCTL